MDAGGFAPSSLAGSAPLGASAAASSASRSAAVRFLPLVDLGFSVAGVFSLFSSPLVGAASLPAAAFVFFDRGFAGAFLGAGSALGWSLMREERRGSTAAASAGAAALRGIAFVVGEGEKVRERRERAHNSRLIRF